MRRGIEEAQDRIHLETYILRNDTTGRSFVNILERKARDGLAVRLLYDALGSFGLDSALFTGLRRAGAEVVTFNPLRRTYPHWMPRRRDHRKLLVVDGAVAFTGGLNIGDEYNTGLSDDRRAWRDTHARIRGPAVRDLEAVFLESWFRADGPDLPWTELTTGAPAQCGNIRCAVVPDGPVYRRRVTRDLLLMGLRTAQSTVCLTSPYFAPDRKVLGQLVETSNRGIKVQILLAGLTDHPWLRHAARGLLPRLCAAGVEIFEYGQSMLHAKTGVFDSSWAVVGTSNLDRQSFEHSFEVNLVIEGGEIPGDLMSEFQHDLSSSSRVDTQSLADRNPFERLIDWLAGLLLRIL